MTWLIFIAALFVSFSNGANDNFKGFATVWGSDTLTYRRALSLATIATLAGSLTSLLLADTLVQQFSGKGLVPDTVASMPGFVFSVASGTAITVLLATRLG
ncbi:MAG: inorganic phosphate transporter, partial [Burkholderiales bacterium]|nr:inorganic phosphate transporter [Burkholderiales bacterium]